MGWMLRFGRNGPPRTVYPPGWGSVAWPKAFNLKRQLDAGIPPLYCPRMWSSDISDMGASGIRRGPLGPPWDPLGPLGTLGPQILLWVPHKFENLPKIDIWAFWASRMSQKTVWIPGLRPHGEIRAGIIRRIPVPVSQVVGRRPIWWQKGRPVPKH